MSTRERPILFSAAMVRGVRDGRKTQTRRCVKPQPSEHVTGGTYNWNGSLPFTNMPIDCILDACPYGKPGDRLWVREAWNSTMKHALAPGEVIGKSLEKCIEDNKGFNVAAHEGIVYAADGVLRHPLYGKALWRPSIHMPRWASRMTLEITAVRLERLCDISEVDAKAEGIIPDPNDHLERTHRLGFCVLWDAIYGDGAWGKNPWVWVVEFRRIQG